MTDEGGRRVLITGIAGVLAGRLAERLEADDAVTSIVGLGLREPRHVLNRTEYVRADLRSPLVAKVVESTGVDTIVHLDITATPQRAGGRSQMKEHNVIGTMQLLGAAQKAPGLRKMVVKSTTAVYGSHYGNPALLREDAAPDAPRQEGYGKDAVDVENYARAFGRRREDVTLTILRFANFIGPRVETPLTRYFSLPVVPTMLGYDPRLQLCHEDDAVEVLYRSVRGDQRGIYNVAGPGMVYLSQAIRLAGRIPLPVPLPFVNGLGGLVRSAGRVDFSPDQLRLLMYGRVGDIGRLREGFGYEPAYSTKEALADFIASGRVHATVERDTVGRVERHLAALLTSGGDADGPTARAGT